MNKYVLYHTPKTLITGIAPLLVTFGALKFYSISYNSILLLLTFLCLILLQISTNLVNDYYDGIRGTDGEDRIGPVRFTSNAEVSQKGIKLFFTITFALAFLTGLYISINSSLIVFY